MKNSTQDERRRAQRLNCTVPVDGKEDGVFAETCTVDLSRGGVGFISKQPIPLEEEVVVALELDPLEAPVLVMGRVQWVRQDPASGEYRVGMKFISALSAESRLRLEQYAKRKFRNK